jgi:glutamyl-tRNA reductase
MHRIGVVGCSYRHASAEQVARFALPRAELPVELPRLRAALGGAELLYLTTCNRVEVVFVLPEGEASDLRPAVFRALTGREPAQAEAASSLRAWTGEAAVEHLFMVACGLDSAQAGEQEIYVQLRAAWQAARSAQVSGPLLDRIVSEALAMARAAHRLASHHAPSLADLAVERIGAHVNGAAHPVALIGVSPMTRRCGARLKARGAELIVVNRSLEPAQELAAELGARALSLEGFRRQPPADCAALICASGASEPVLDAAALRRLQREGALQPLIVDFGLPPNVDPDDARALGLVRIGMDDLVQAAREDRVTHLLRLAPVRAAIDERLARLRSELAARAIGPRLAELRSSFERIAAQEVDRLLKSELAQLDEAQRARLTGWAQTLAHRLAHLPLSGLRAAAEHSSLEATEAFFREARLSRPPGASDKES